VEYSVVIPSCNAARTLPLVLDALAVQERRPLEVNVVDDGSSDGTAQVAEARGAR
jgi:4,4'-diaponeurosporenoate glycosyltransferase